MAGRTIALYSETGGGKTTQIGDLAKSKFKATGLRTLLTTSDLGGYDSIMPLVRLGVVIPREIKQDDDPWIWINNSVEANEEGIGLYAYDSGTSMGEALFLHITKNPENVGQMATQRFKVSKGKQTLTVGSNNEAHYGLVQSFMLDKIWRSTWQTEQPQSPDVMWTFSLFRGEAQDQTQILGPKLAGKALTASIPKWFNYTFRLVCVPQSPGESPVHSLYIQAQPEMGGMGTSSSNARYPLEATTPLPAVITPASVSEALKLIEQGQQEAEDALRSELGL